MKRIVDYVIEERTNVETLQREVLKLITCGWQPFGGLVVSSFPSEGVSLGGVAYAQTLVRYEDEE